MENLQNMGIDSLNVILRANGFEEDCKKREEILIWKQEIKEVKEEETFDYKLKMQIIDRLAEDLCKKSNIGIDNARVLAKVYVNKNEKEILEKLKKTEENKMVSKEAEIKMRRKTRYTM